MRLGVHVSIAGKIYDSLDRAHELGCEAMQIFSRNPRGWQEPKFTLEDAEEFRRRKKRFDIYPVVVHIPYTINLASPDDALYERSILSYIKDIKAADSLDSEYFVTHLGSHTGSGEKQGVKRFQDALNRIIEKAKPQCMILLETTAGQGDSLGHRFAQIGELIRAVKDKSKIGVCLDTAHVFAAGYDITTKQGFSDTISEFDSAIGIEKLKVIHINDSMSGFGSRVDRHENITKGKIGEKGFDPILSHPKTRKLSFILETPKKKPADDAINLKKLREIYKRVNKR